MPVLRHGVAAVTLGDGVLMPGGGTVQGLQPTNHVDQFFLPLLAGDIDADGDVDLTDRDQFVGVLTGADTDADHVARSDVNADGAADAGDIAPFMAVLLVA